ncbi:MAG: hypothetical protein ACR2PQ_03100 [Myxococcota bacterium]
MNRWPLAWIAIFVLAGASLGCGKYAPPIRSEYPEETRPDWVVVPPAAEPAPAAGTPGNVPPAGPAPAEAAPPPPEAEPQP